MPSQHRHGQRDQISDFISPDNGLRGKMLRNGIQPKDHMKQNRKELKESQQIIREQKDAESRPPKELYKLEQFKDVPSKVFDNLKESRKVDEQRVFLSKGLAERRREELARDNKTSRTELQLKLEEAKYYADQPATPRKAPVPKPNELITFTNPVENDFISKNKANAVTMIPYRKDEKTSSSSKHDDYGRVPEYLQERKAQWAEQESEARKRLPDPNCPPGMCLMSENERLSTLEVLQQSKEEALIQLRKLPFVIEMPSMIKRQKTLESKLREIDNALMIFNKTKVFIAIDR